MALYVAPESLEQDASGFALSGAKLNFYVEGTSTRKDTYSNIALTVAHTNPVVADSAGRFDPIYMDGAYKVVLTDSADAVIWTKDNYSTGSSTDFFGDTATVSVTTAIDASYEKKNILASGTINLNLFASATAGEGFVFAVRNTSSGVITIDPNASETINGSATITLTAGQSALVVSDGTNWFTLFNDTISLGSDNAFTGANSFAGTTTFTGNVSFDGKASLSADGTRTIATGAITTTGSYHTIETQSAAASDDLDSITSTGSGLLTLFRAHDATHTVVVKHNTGNIYNPNLLDISLDETNRVIGTIYDNTLVKHIILFDGTTREYVDQEDGKWSAKLLHIQDQKTAGTDAGGFTSGSWQTRVLNTEVTDEIGSTLASNQFTLPAGTYYIEASAPAFSCNLHKARLYNITDAAAAIIGTAEYSANGAYAGSRSFVTGRFTIAGTKTFELQHQCSLTKTTDGLGRAADFSAVEIYSDVKIWTVA